MTLNDNNVQETGKVEVDTVTPNESIPTAGNEPAKDRELTSEKTLTQDEVNRIVQKRLREKDAKINELIEKTKELEKYASDLEVLKYEHKKIKTLSMAKDNKIDVSSLSPEDIKQFVDSSSEIFDEDSTLKTNEFYLKKKFPKLKLNSTLGNTSKMTDTPVVEEESFYEKYLKTLKGEK